MKKIFILSMLMSLALICSCGRQDSGAEQQLSQRKVELDTRENALAERESSLDARETALNEREKTYTEREKAIAKVRTTRPDQTPNASQSQDERDARLQRVPAEFRPLVPDPSQMKAAKTEKERMAHERLTQAQRAPEELQSRRQRKVEAMQKWQTSDAAGSPAAEETSPSASPTPE